MLLPMQMLVLVVAAVAAAYTYCHLFAQSPDKTKARQYKVLEIY